MGQLRVTTLESKCNGVPNLLVCHGSKTFEYDLALANWRSEVLLIPGIAHEAGLRRLATNPADCDDTLAGLLSKDGAKESLDRLAPEELPKALYATCYLLSLGRKGEIAFDLMHQLRENLAATPDKKLLLDIPKHIEKAVRWACRQITAGG